MRSPGTSTLSGGLVTADTITPATHFSSHATLLGNAPMGAADLHRSRHSRPDAIIVPATRPASALSGVIQLAADLQTPIVVLCSKQAKLDQVAERIGRVLGARGIAIQVDAGYRLPGLTFETSSGSFTSVSAERSSDLSVKRNIGLLLARLHGWRKIAFIDDDITVSVQDMTRLGHRLESYRIAGMACRDYPDNSVFCHARRLAEMPQDVFVTGAVLGVNCCDLPLPFFPDIYNEDWFFFAEAAARRQLIKVGDACQVEYDPYADPERARHEEFGDLLAEGLYSLIEGLYLPTDHERPGFFPTIASIADEKYWDRFIDVRRVDLIEAWSRLADFTDRDSCSDQVPAAMRSLEAAEERYDDRSGDRITPQHCVAFVDALQHDIHVWNSVYQGTNTAHSTADALKRLHLENWTSLRLTPDRAHGPAAAPATGKADDQPVTRVRFPRGVPRNSATWRLYAALGELHERAGHPSARELGRTLGMTLSRVDKVFEGEPLHLNRPVLLRIVATLAQQDLRPNVADVMRRFDALWDAMRAELRTGLPRTGSPGGRDPLPSRSGPRRRPNPTAPTSLPDRAEAV